MFWLFMQFLLSRLLLPSLRIESGSFPKPLKAAEETELFEQMQQGDTGARDKLISHNLRLVVHIVKKYYAATCEQEDLISIGTIGLIKAVNSFHPAGGTKFSTYAARCIENEILMYFRSMKKTKGTVSLHDAIESDKDGNALVLEDVVADETDVGENCEDREERTTLLQAVQGLDSRSRRIVALRFGLYGQKPHTQLETAHILCISRSYVSRLEKRALALLRKELEKTKKQTDAYC